MCKVAEQERIELLWCNISNFNRTCQFLLCTFSVFFFFIFYAYLLEYLFGIEGLKHHGWYFTEIQFLCYTIFGFIEQYYKKKEREAPMKYFYFLAIITVGSIGLSNTSLKYINYPTQVIFKSCKLIPVMVGGILITNKQYKLTDYLGTFCMCLGLIVFTLADVQVQPNFNIIGIGMITVALIFDAIIGNLQEKIFKKYDLPNYQIVLYSYGIGFVYLTIVLCANGDFFRGYRYCYLRPVLYVYMFLFSLCGYLGVQGILTLIRIFGALTTVTITNCRKVLTIIISFLCFEKAFTIVYIWGGIIILLGIYLSLLKRDFNSLKHSCTCQKRKKLKELPDIV